jgi:hypothetical protein
MHGQLFTSDFLREGIRETPGWRDSETGFVAFRESVTRIFGEVSSDTALNEAQTEDEVILPVLQALGWTQFLRQATANQRGRQDVPDFLLFASAEDKQAGRAERRPDRRFRFGKLIVEAKRWQRPLDRGDATDHLDPGTPSSQMLRYLSRAEVASERAVQWGILTNGAAWRLYWQSARSRSEEFLEFDLAALAGVAGLNADLFAQADAEQVHYLRAFYLLFRREAFLPQPGDPEGRSFHAITLAAGRMWESKVSQDLGQRVFDELFPKLATAIARHDPRTPDPPTREHLDAIQRAALILLYRLLFVLFAEDRNLLPVSDSRYDDYSLRWLREDIARRTDQGDVFSATASRAWQHLRGLFRVIDRGDASIGLPPYNGGLFHEQPDDILARIELPDAQLVPLIDGLSRRPDISGRGFINYRDLAVQHLGSIYERLLEQRLAVADDGHIAVELSVFARKNTGSYYTHDDLVKLILRETLGPLVQGRIDAFQATLANVHGRRNRLAPEQIANALTQADAAAAILALRICDPAMGSGHFLVSLVDDLADRILEQLADASARAQEAGITHYQSPVARDIVALRERILAHARESGWTIDPSLLDDRHLVRRMILKRVVHGVDKNPMAVELAKLALWLHTFTVGAPLSFLDHHLRCGDSLYGEQVATVRAEISRHGGLLADSQLTGLLNAAEGMSEISRIADVDLAEVERSRTLAESAFSHLEGLRRVLDFWQALRWIAPLDIPRTRWDEKQLTALDLISGRYGNDLIALLAPDRNTWGDPATDARVNGLLEECRALARRERFLHWQLAFPGVWKNPGSVQPQGGFDAMIGNPPWDRIKLQEVEWFAERRPDIARQSRAADRKRFIEELRRNDDPLYADYELAAQRAEDSARIARSCGDYPLLSSGDINLYALFVERASHLVKPDGIVGLLTPSGIAADKGAAKFFRSIATTGRLAALFDFENKRVFFPDIHASFKFCVLAFAGPLRGFDRARCAFYLHAVDELAPPELPGDADDAARLRATRLIELDAADFRAVNPNTGTAPIFRNALDAALTTRIYRSHPVLVQHLFDAQRDPLTNEALRSADGTPLADPDRVIGERRLYPVRYRTMFHMTNDSGLFHTAAELRAGGWYPVAGGRWKKGDEEMLPLYEGKMVQMYDHRAAGVTVNPDNVHRPAQPVETTDEQHRDPDYVPPPQFWVNGQNVREIEPNAYWYVGFKEITAPTNVRSMIAAMFPRAGFGNKIPIWIPNSDDALHSSPQWAPTMLANFNSFAFDFVVRQKLQGQTLNLFIVEQLPLIAPAAYEAPLGTTTVGDFVRNEVLHLSYTANDLATLAHDLGHDGPPFAWDDEDRRHRMARLDALYFRLYGLDRDEAAYVLDTFPIVREQDMARFNRYRTRELVLGYMNALAAGDTTTVLAL